MITDVYLNEIAKAINGETDTVISHCAFSSTVLTPAATDTSIAHEYDRSSASGTRINNAVTFNAIRSGATASSTGDYINLVGMFTDVTSGSLMIEALVPSVLHTTSFDFEVDATVTIERK